MILRLCLRLELRHIASEVGCRVKVVVLSVASGQIAVCHRRERHETDMQFIQHREQGFMPPSHHRVAVLYCCQWADCVSLADNIFGGLGDTPMGDFSLLDQVSYGSRNFFHGHLWIDTVLIVKVNVVSSQSAETTFHGGTDRFRAAVQQRTAGTNGFQPEFCGDYHLVTDIFQCLAHQFLVVGGRAICIGTNIDLCGVKKSVSHLIGAADNPNGICLFQRCAIGMGQHHATKSHGADLQIIS